MTLKNYHINFRKRTLSKRNVWLCFIRCSRILHIPGAPREPKIKNSQGIISLFTNIVRRVPRAGITRITRNHTGVCIFATEIFPRAARGPKFKHSQGFISLFAKFFRRAPRARITRITRVFAFCDAEIPARAPRVEN